MKQPWLLVVASVTSVLAGIYSFAAGIVAYPASASCSVACTEIYTKAVLLFVLGLALAAAPALYTKQQTPKRLYLWAAALIAALTLWYTMGFSASETYTWLGYGGPLTSLALLATLRLRQIGQD